MDYIKNKIALQKAIQNWIWTRDFLKKNIGKRISHRRPFPCIGKVPIKQPCPLCELKKQSAKAHSWCYSCCIFKYTGNHNCNETPYRAFVSKIYIEERVTGLIIQESENMVSFLIAVYNKLFVKPF